MQVDLPAGVMKVSTYRVQWIDAHAPPASDYDTIVLLLSMRRKKMDTFFFFLTEARSNSKFLSSSSCSRRRFFFCILHRDQIRATHACLFCQRKWEHAHLIAVSLVVTDRVTAPCQGIGSRSQTRHRSKAINSIRVRERARAREKQQF